MDASTTMYIVIGLLAVFFIVLLIFSAKTWRILHMLSAFFVFIGAGFLVWFVAATLQTDANWREAVTVYEAKVAEKEEEARRLLEGTVNEEDRPAIPNSPFTQVEFIEDSIHDVQAALERTLLDRGRVWRGCTPSVTNNNAATATVQLTIPASSPAPVPTDGEQPADEEPPADGEPPAGEEGEDPAEPAPVAPGGTHGIVVNTVVYGFLEGPSELEDELAGHIVPTLYLGEFRVTDRTDNTITVQATIPLTPLQAANLGAGKWTIYDNMPIDAHYAFAGLTEAELRTLFPRERLSLSPQQYNARIAELSRYFEGFADGDLAAKIPMSSVIMNDAQYEAFIDSYLRTGQAADEGTDPAERTWYKVEFNAPTTIQIDGVLTNIGGDPTTANFESKNVVAVQRSEGEVIIAEPSLIPGKPGDESLGNFSMSMTVSDALKQVSDWNIDPLWDKERTPQQLRQLTALSPEQLQEVLDAKSIEFDLGDTAMLDARTTKRLEEIKIGKDKDKSVVKTVEPIYVRPLREYATYFNDGYRQELQFEDEANIIKLDTLTILSANAKALEQVNYRDDEIDNLRHDRAGFEREAAAMMGVLATVQDRFTKTRARLSQLFRTNAQLAEEIRSMQTEADEAIRRANRDAAPDAPLPEAVSAP